MSDQSEQTAGEVQNSGENTNAGILATVSGAAKVIGKLGQVDTYGVLGENTASSGSDSHGVVGVTDSEDTGVAGVKGEARAQGDGGTQGHGSYGVHGITQARANTDAPGDPVGVKGEAKAAENNLGVSRGVVGVTSGGRGYGGLFENENGSENGATGLKGISYSDGEYARGVRGEARSSTAAVYGVDGSVFADNTEAAGVRGVASGRGIEAAGVRGESSDGYGVYSTGETRSDGLFEAGNGVLHEQRAPPGTDELDTGEVMVYNSDGSGDGQAGDLMYAVNVVGTIKTAVIVDKDNAT